MKEDLYEELTYDDNLLLYIKKLRKKKKNIKAQTEPFITFYEGGYEIQVPWDYYESECDDCFCEDSHIIHSIERLEGSNNVENDAFAQMLYYNIFKSDKPVLITGESGTGKEYVSRRISAGGERNPFIPVDCGSKSKEMFGSELFGHEQGAFTGAIRLHKGFFEIADNGTILLDEICNIDLDLQAKLLRFTDTNEFNRLGSTEIIKSNARIIFATNKDVEKEIAAGRFREDLKNRISFNIKLKPFSQRKDKLYLFLKCLFLKSKRKNWKFENIKDVINWFKETPFNGNIRDLLKLADFMTAWDNPFSVERLSKCPYIKSNSQSGSIDSFRHLLPLHQDKVEEINIRLAMEKFNNNKTKICACLGIKDADTLNEKIKKYKISLQ